MKVWYFVLYALYWLFGCFTIAFITMDSQTIGVILGCVWGFIIAKDAISRFM